MTAKEILSKTDHTLLRPDATWQQIQTVLDEGMAFGTASVCLPPCFVKEAVSYVGGALPICTVIGFPNGYATTASKCFEAEDAVKNGAAEIDMVIQIGLLKEGKDEALLKQINAVRQSCGTFESHCRNLYADRGGKSARLPRGGCLRCGIYQNQHRLCGKRRGA